MKLQPVGFIFLLSIATLIATANSFNYRLMKSVQIFKNIKTLIILTCETTPKSFFVHTFKNLQSDGNGINVMDISNGTDMFKVNFESFFVRLSCSHIVVCSLTCQHSIRFLNEISKLRMFHSERNWLMLSDNLENSVNVLSRENINSDAEITVVQQNNDKDTKITFNRFFFITSEYELFDVYNPSFKRHGKLNVTKIGCWSYNDSKLNFQSKFEERRNFGGLTFHSVITIPKHVNKTLFEHISSIENVQTDSIDRLNYHLFKLIKEIYNFKLFVRRSNIWGVKMSDGSWRGSIGMLNRSEVDIMMSGVRWDNERYGAFDQTTSSYFFKVVFMFRHPENVDTFKVFTSPFEPKLWLVITLVALLIVFGIHQAFTMENENVVQDHLHQIGNDRSYSSCIIIVFGYLFQQGYSGNPLLASSRIFTTTILSFSIMIYQFYGSFIVGSLLTESPKTITTVKSLLESNLYIYMGEVPYILDNLKRVKEKSAVHLLNKVMAQNPIFKPVSKGVTMIKRGHVFHTDASYAYLLLKDVLTGNEICDLQEIKYQEKLQCGPGVPVKSHLREWIKVSLRRIQETGLMAYHWKIWMGHQPKCENNDLDVIPVDIVHFSSALYGLVIGMKISLGFLMAEVIIDRIH